MNNAEAKAMLTEHIDRLRKLPYAELCKYENSKRRERIEIIGKSGKSYQLVTEAVWDNNKKQDNLRVIVSIDDRGWRAFFPMTKDFIIAPNGAFVGEQGGLG